MQWEGFDVQGTWTWATNANVTNWASVRAEAAGYWHNTSHANGDEYEYIGLFLGPGNYSIDIWYTTDADHGKVDIYYGLTFITTLDQYTAVPGYNGHPSPINFSLTVETSANLTFTVNGKNAASSDFYVDWQRFEITKTG